MRGRGAYPQSMQLPQSRVLGIAVLGLVQLRKEDPASLGLIVKQQVCFGESLQKRHIKKIN